MNLKEFDSHNLLQVEELITLNSKLERLHCQDTLLWAWDIFQDDLCMATSFGPSTIVIAHMLSLLRLKIPIFYLQTNLLFPEIKNLKDKLSTCLDIEFTEVHSGLSLKEQEINYGPELWKNNPDLCCQLRKVNAIHSYLAKKKMWISGIRRDQSANRTSIQLLSWDNTHHLLKINPLAFWSKDQVWKYILEHNLPYNPLHDQGYPSIGCIPCTTRINVLTNQDERIGRWFGTNKTECGIHIQSDGKLKRLVK